MASSDDQELVSKFGSFLKSEPDICEGGVDALWLVLTTQWGADESVPSRPFPSPRHHIPLWPAALTLERNPLGIHPPPQTATCPPKSTFCTVLRWRAFLFLSRSGLVEPSQWWAVLYRQTKEETTITLGHWSALSGLKRLWWGKAGWGVLHREVSVSWATTLIVCPCPKFPITPHLLPLPIFFFPSLVVHKAPSWAKGTGFCMKVSVWYLRELFSWLTWKKKVRSKGIFSMKDLRFSSLNLLIPLSTTNPAWPALQADGTRVS